jgi:acetoacetyl-[acyl-carrier protein] synthase
MSEYLEKRAASEAASETYLERADRGDYAPIYRFGEDMIAESDITITETSVTIQGLANEISLPTKNAYEDMTN